MLSNDLSWMRSALEETFPDTCHLLTLTRTSDSQGGWTESWGTATINAACRLDSKKAVELLAADNLRSYHTYTLTVPYDTTITTAMRVEHDSQIYNVTSVTFGSWKIDKRAELELV